MSEQEVTAKNIAEQRYTARDLKQMYRVLPRKSKGREADNPIWFDIFLSDKQTDVYAWPYAMLCKDKERDCLTWHIICDEAIGLLRHVEEQNIGPVNERLSMMRGRELKCIELLYNRTGEYKHHFIPSQSQ